jgi:glutathione S-transferase
MIPRLYGHPFSSYTQKALIAFYEKDAPFEFAPLDAEHPDNLARHRELWPLARFPVIELDRRALFEASVIIEWLDLRTPTLAPLIPRDAEAALEARMRDRIFDNYVMEPMQRIVFDRLRPEEARDAYGVSRARGTLDRIYDWLEREMASREWATGDHFQHR